mgnify:CR=1 FL=1
MKFLRIFFAGLLLLATMTAQAQPQLQPYPHKTVRLVIGFPPGAFTDVMARMLAEHLTAQYGQQVGPTSSRKPAPTVTRCCSAT